MSDSEPSTHQWWIIVRAPDEIRCWNIGNPNDNKREDLLNRARTAVGFPARDEWAWDGSPWEVSLHAGEPHPSIRGFEDVNVHDVAELLNIDPAIVTAHAAARTEATRAAQAQGSVDVALSAIAALDPNAMKALVAALQSSTSYGEA